MGRYPGRAHGSFMLPKILSNFAALYYAVNFSLITIFVNTYVVVHLPCAEIFPSLLILLNKTYIKNTYTLGPVMSYAMSLEKKYFQRFPEGSLKNFVSKLFAFLHFII